jgi:hypothetical protein
MSDRSTSAIFMNARARIEVLAKDFLLTLITHNHASTALWRTLFDVVDILCDWIYKDRAQGNAL